MNYKIAFFDIDNTIYDWKHRQFVDSGIKAIERLKKEGVHCVISTARPYHSVKHFDVFDLGIKFDGFIGSAGGIVMWKNAVVYKQLMDPEITKKLCKTILSHGLTAEVITPKNRFLIAPPNDYLYNFHSVFTDVIPEVHPYTNQDSTGLLLHAPQEYDGEFKSLFPTVGYYRFDAHGVDIMPAPRNKGDAMSMLLDHLGLKKEDAIAFGDDIQDISMAKAAKLVCMGNGKDEVKAIADEVTDEIWNDGLAKAIYHNFGW